MVDAINEALDIGKRPPASADFVKRGGNANLGPLEGNGGAGGVRTCCRAGCDHRPVSVHRQQHEPFGAIAGCRFGRRIRTHEKNDHRSATRARMAAEILQNARNTQRPSFAYAVIASHAADPKLNGKVFLR